MLFGKKLLSVAAGVALVVSASQVSRASYIAADSNALLSGSVTVNNTGTTGTLNVTVDYAVYAPGTFHADGTLTSIDNVFGGSPTDLTGIPDYVYLYVVNDLPSSTLDVNLASVGTQTGATLLDAGSNSSLGGTAPYYQSVVSNSFINLFPSYVPGSSSAVVMFASPQAPAFQNSTVGNGGLNDALLLPSPAVPEPATFCLLAGSGLATLLLGRKGRRAQI